MSTAHRAARRAQARAVNPEPQHIRSRDNPSLVLVRRALRDPAAYRREGALLWLEGDHLLRACAARGLPLRQVLLTEAAWAQPALRALAQRSGRVLVLPQRLFEELSALPSPAAIGALIERPAATPLRGDVGTVLLDRLQDAGNVGSILRSAAAFGVRQVLALAGTAGLWSPKVLRAAMGAQFALGLVEGLDEAALGALKVPLLGTSPHARASIADAPPPSPAAWVFGHEGQGVAPWLTARCAHTLRIPQPGGQESLNVAAAAAVCLYEATRRSPA